MKRILFAVDLSEPADVTARVASLADALEAELLVAHVSRDISTAAIESVDPMTGMGGFSYTHYDPELDERFFEAEGEAFDTFLRERFSIPVAAKLLRGHPADAILEAADGFDADLIVLGKRHHSALERLLVGSVASEVVERCGCPTLLVPVPEA